MKLLKQRGVFVLMLLIASSCLFFAEGCKKEKKKSYKPFAAGLVGTWKVEKFCGETLGAVSGDAALATRLAGIPIDNGNPEFYCKADETDTDKKKNQERFAEKIRTDLLPTLRSMEVTFAEQGNVVTFKWKVGEVWYISEAVYTSCEEGADLDFQVVSFPPEKVFLSSMLKQKPEGLYSPDNENLEWSSKNLVPLYAMESQYYNFGLGGLINLISDPWKSSPILLVKQNR